MAKLTHVAVMNAKPDSTKIIRLKDEGGLYLEIPPKGSKRWRLRYWIAGKENRISLGVFPAVSLKDACELRDEARKLIAKGLSPSAVRKGKAENSFERVAREWHEKNLPKWTPGHAASTLTAFEKHVFP